jgi:N2227-like protein
MLVEWRARLHMLLLELDREAETLRAELRTAGLVDLTRTRLELLAAAHEDHARRLQKLLAPLDIAVPQDGEETYETYVALGTRLPHHQGLMNYYVNVHRDWAWGAAENDASIALIQAALPAGYHWGRTLVLGAGGGRLAYDVHMRFAPSLTAAVDFNPLLLFVAHAVTSGGHVELYEFPIAPRRLQDHAVLRQLAAPAPVRAGFYLLAADALQAPFRPASFDTVLTPWFIDIVDEDLTRFAARVNGLLRPGGAWINFGSLAFSQADRRRRFGVEEAREIVNMTGFSLAKISERAIPYMQSPASRHGRLEMAVAWCARKERDAPPPEEHSTLPEWLLHGDRAVPLLESFRVQAVSTEILAFLMALIDGQRTVQDMARLLIDQRLMAPQDAEPAVRRFLTRMYAESCKRAAY